MLYIAFHKKRYITCIKVLVLYDTILKQYYFIIISYLYCRFALQIVYLLIVYCAMLLLLSWRSAFTS
jgi:hypothetical protein